MEFQEMFDIMVESHCVTIGFAEFHAQAEKELGHPIYTHEFGPRGNTNLNLKIALLIRKEGYIFRFKRDGNPIETLVNAMDYDS